MTAIRNSELESVTSISWLLKSLRQLEGSSRYGSTQDPL